MQHSSALRPTLRDRVRQLWGGRSLTERRAAIAFFSFGLLGFGKSASILTRLMIVRLVTHAELGLFSVAIALISLTAMLSVMGMPQGMIRYAARFENENNTGGALRGLFAYPVLIAFLLGGLIGVVLMAMRTAGLLDPTPGLSNRVLLLTLCAIPGQALLILLPWSVLAQHKPTFYLVGTQLLFNGAFLAAVGVQFLVSGGNADLQTLLLIYVGTTWAAVLVMGTLLLGILRRAGHLDAWNLKLPPAEFFSYSAVVLGSSLSYVALGSVDRLVMGWEHVAPAQIGLYSVAFTVAAAIPSILILVDTHASPKLASAFAVQDMQEAARVYQQANASALYLASPVIVGLILLKSQVLALFGSDFQSAGPILVAMLAGEYIHVVLGITARMLQLGGRPRADAAMIVLAALMNLGLNLLLIPRHGVLGAVLATLLTRIFLFGGEAYLIYRGWGILPWDRNRWPLKVLLFAGVILVFCLSIDLKMFL